MTIDSLKKPQFPHGREMFPAALCATCHRFGAEGGAGGPDLTGLGGRMTVNDLATAIIDPSKDISDQYAFTEFSLRGGATMSGRVAREDKGSLFLITTFLAPESLTEVPKGSILAQQTSKISPMLPHLIDGMNREEVLDLFSFLMSGK